MIPSFVLFVDFTVIVEKAFMTRHKNNIGNHFSHGLELTGVKLNISGSTIDMRTQLFTKGLLPGQVTRLSSLKVFKVFDPLRCLCWLSAKITLV